MVKTKKTKDQVPDNPSQDDEEAVKLHLQELDKELKKKYNQDSDKTTRLLSLTFHAWRSETLSVTATTCISTFLDKYGCFKRPIAICEFCVEVNIHPLTIWIILTASTGDVPC